MRKGAVFPALPRQDAASRFSTAPVDVVGVEAQVALLHVLLDGRLLLILRHINVRTSALTCNQRQLACQTGAGLLGTLQAI